jgi:hypothetical protein
VLDVIMQLLSSIRTATLVAGNAESRSTKMASLKELEIHWDKKRKLLWALVNDAPIARIKELIDAIPFDIQPSTKK